MKKVFDLKQFSLNLESAIEDVQYLKKEDEELRFRIETNVNDAKVRIMIIQKNRIIEVKTFDEDGEQSSRLIKESEEKN